jgi:hypothetical protein
MLKVSAFPTQISPPDADLIRQHGVNVLSLNPTDFAILIFNSWLL